jgi:hypothetical protein
MLHISVRSILCSVQEMPKKGTSSAVVDAEGVRDKEPVRSARINRAQLRKTEAAASDIQTTSDFGRKYKCICTYRCAMA